MVNYTFAVFNAVVCLRRIATEECVVVEATIAAFIIVIVNGTCAVQTTV